MVVNILEIHLEVFVEFLLVDALLGRTGALDVPAVSLHALAVLLVVLGLAPGRDVDIKICVDIYRHLSRYTALDTAPAAVPGVWAVPPVWQTLEPGLGTPGAVETANKG